MRLALRIPIVLIAWFVLLQSPFATATADKQAVPAPAPQAPAPPQAPSGDKPQVFRAGVEIVSLNVTVTDPQGHYITDLGQDDFSVFEDGAKQDLTYFNRTNLPIALSLLIDSSASME